MSNETAAGKMLVEMLEAAGGTVVDVTPYTPSEPGAHCRISAEAGLAVMNGTGDNHPRCAACGKAWSGHLGCEPLCAKLKVARAAFRLILSDGQSREHQIARDALEAIE